MKRFDVAPELLVRDEKTRLSSYCFIARNDELQNLLANEFGRDGLCLKVFKRKPDEPIEKFIWGRVPLVGATKVQNLFGLNGLSPRVYDIILLNDRQVAQVTDYVRGRTGEWHAHKIKDLSKRYGVKTRKWRDFGPANWAGGKFVDFSEFYFEDGDAYERSLVERAYTRKKGSNPAGIAYQSVPELGINGTRNLEHRLSVLKLEQVNFVGKTVLDLGCNLGLFSRLACAQGAKRVVGVDRSVALAYEISNWLGYWNIDYLNLNLSLPVDTNQIAKNGIEKFDIVFSMAIHNYMKGNIDWIADLCRGTFIFEGHGGDAKEVYEDFLHRDFDRVEHLGQTTDNYTRQVFRAEKK